MPLIKILLTEILCEIKNSLRRFSEAARDVVQNEYSNTILKEKIVILK